MPETGQQSYLAPLVVSSWMRHWPNLCAGVITAIGLFATDIGYGYLSYAPLGESFASTGIAAAFLSSVLGSLIPAMVGGSGPMFGGPRPAQTLIYAMLLHHLLTSASTVAPERIIIVGTLCVSLAGIIQMMFGYLGLGRIIRFTPLPVLAGFTNGVALSMMLTAGTIIFGSHLPGTPDGLETSTAILRIGFVGLVLSMMLQAHRTMPRLHWSLAGLLIGTFVYFLATEFAPALSLGEMLPAVTDVHASSGLVAVGFGWLATYDWGRDLNLVLPPALSLAVLNSIESLVIASQQDLTDGTRHDSRRVLVGQGLGNLVCGLMGALPSAPSNSRQLVSRQIGGYGRVASIVFAFAMLVMLFLTPYFASLIPQIALASILLYMAYSIIDPWAKSQIRTWWHGEGSAEFRSQLRSNLWIMAVVMTVTVAVNLVAALAAGVLLSMLLFIRSSSKSNVSRIFPGNKRHSAVMRPLAHIRLLKEHGHEIALVELAGPLFFGSGELLLDEIETLSRQTRQIILDFRQVSTIDASGASAIQRIAQRMRQQQVRLVLSSISLDDPRGRPIVQAGRNNELPPSCWYEDPDIALESAEDTVLEACKLPEAAPPQRMLDLDGLKNLSEAEIAILLDYMEERTYKSNEYLFKRGDAGDTMYMLLSGRIEIRLPVNASGQFKRLVALRPGTVFGEMAILRGAARSADAVATEDSTEVLSIKSSDLDRLHLEHPRIALTLMRNIGAHLAARLASSTEELQHALSAGVQN